MKRNTVKSSTRKPASSTPVTLTARILTALRGARGKALSMREIAAILGEEYQRVRYTVQKMYESRHTTHVERVDRGPYRLAKVAK